MNAKEKKLQAARVEKYGNLGSDENRAIAALAAMIQVVDPLWGDAAARHQADLYLCQNIRDHRIADTTIMAVELAKMVAGH